MNVLIVDDERIIRKGLRAAVPWSNLGINHVFEASSGIEALDILNKESPEIIITDIQMAEMTGLDLISEIRKSKNDVKIIVLTGYDEFDYARECLRMQVQDFLLKPVEEETLINSVKNQIDAISEKRSETKKEKHMRRIIGSAEQEKIENCMRNLIHKNDVDESTEIVKETFEHLIGKKLRVVILLPSVYLKGIVEGESESLSLLTIKNLLLDLLDANQNGITFTDFDGQLLLVLSEGEKSDVLENHITTVVKLIQEECNVKLRVIMGSSVAEVEKLYISYNDAVYLRKEEQDKYKTYVVAKKNKGQLEMFREVYLELKTKINDNIGNIDQVLHIFDTFCTASDSYNITDEYVRKCCFELASTVYFGYIVESGENTDGRLNILLSTTLSTDRKGTFEVTHAFIENLLKSKENEDDELISSVKRYINEHITDDITVSGIAAAFCLSPNYFSRLFKRVAREGCNEYIIRKRIELASNLLVDTNMKVGKIAQDVGYNDTNYFSLTFKKQTGLTPLQYRETKR
ncbi:MAG: response regulator [Suipraeoptans sp.]